MTPLLPHHREHLRAGGLTDETVAAAGLFSVSGEGARLGLPAGLTGIAFPYNRRARPIVPKRRPGRGPSLGHPGHLARAAEARKPSTQPIGCWLPFCAEAGT